MKRRVKQLLTLTVFVLGIGSCIDSFDIAWGTGIWWGKFSLVWGCLFFAFCIFSGWALYLFYNLLWREDNLNKLTRILLDIPEKPLWLRWVSASIIFVIPVWLLQFTDFGIAFQGIFLRLSLWIIQLIVLSLLLKSDKTIIVDLKLFLFIAILTATSFSLAAVLRFVTDYPFALGWSEGNRLWDYSIMFGRERYIFPANQEIPVLLELPRQFVGGVPFLIPGITIKMERLWVGLTGVFPYFLLGLATLRFIYREKYLYIAGVLWAFLFLRQGPIHPPLVLCAVIIAFAWRNRPWLSISLVFIATIFAYFSRFTWTFAPLMWFFMVEFLTDQIENNGNLLFTYRYRKLLILFFAGGFSSLLLLALLISINQGWAERIFEFVSSLNFSPEALIRMINDQPLLWYRLLPNETYGNGILVGLFWAVAPLIGILFYFFKSKSWFGISYIKIIFLTSPLIAFLIVGLIVSSKIGGGGDLHNMDMFLIGLFFVFAAIYKNLAGVWITNSVALRPLSINLLLIIAVMLPGLTPLQEMKPYKYSHSASRLIALTDAPNERALNLRPSDSVIKESLRVIRSQIDNALPEGDILFMDQRQLLTFGYITNVPLIPEYDKKVLIEYAMSKRRPYFEQYYSDLKQKRFSLIITQPLNTPKKGSEDGFGEENNAWVKWVAQPLLCYYEIKQTLLEVNVQLLSPKDGPVDCADILP